MRQTFEVAVSYAQLCIFRPTLNNPFNEWTKTHYNQGFSWRHESVSFALPDSGLCEVFLSDEDIPRTDMAVIRSILTPFEVTERSIEIGSISDGKQISVDN